MFLKFSTTGNKLSLVFDVSFVEFKTFGFHLLSLLNSCFSSDSLRTVFIFLSVDPDCLPQWQPADAHWGTSDAGNQGEWRGGILQRAWRGGVPLSWVMEGQRWVKWSNVNRINTKIQWYFNKLIRLIIRVFFSHCIIYI